MAKTKFFKVATLPATLVANAFYFVENGNYAESYLTNNLGVAKMVGNSVMIDQKIANQLAGLSSLEVVDNIASRDALTLTSNKMVLVIDATGDTSVVSGSAMYAWQQSSTAFVKVSEYESMDVIVSWGSISGRPTSSPASIDLAVTNSHTHTNKTSLDKVGQDVEGDITYDGLEVLRWATNNW
jgi:hypothetical protein